MQKAHAETLHTFEYLLLSSALAVLGRGRAQPPQSTAVSALIAQERPDKDKGKNSDSDNNNSDSEYIDIDDLIDP